MEYRIEEDSLREIKVLKDKLWGTQTQRNFQNFKIGKDSMPIKVIRAFTILKKVATLTNMELEQLDGKRD